MRTAVYLRVSTEEQAKEGFSIRAQKERLSAFVESQDWQISDYYIEEGVSAKDMIRPELNRMLSDIKGGHIDVVLVYRLDRLTRSVRDLYNMLDLFEKHNCKFKSATEVYDTTTAMGRLFITLVAALAQWERENLGERVFLGMERMIEEGLWHGGVVPYGFEYIKEEKKLQINVEEAHAIKLFCFEYIKGMGFETVSKHFNDRGYTTRRGVRWTGKMIKDVITNPVICGHLRWNDELYRNFTDAIIEDEVLEQILTISESRRSFHPRLAGRSKYPFSGVLKCARCGKPLKGTVKNGRLRKDNTRAIFRGYVCTGKRSDNCTLKEINEVVVENTFLDKIKSEMNKYIKLSEAQKKQKKDSETERRIGNLRSQLKKVSGRVKRWRLLYADKEITLNELKDYTEEDKLLEDELTTELDSLSQDEEEDPIIAANKLNDFLANWNELGIEEKKTALMIFVDRIEIDAEERRGSKKEMRQAWITSLNFK